jgi:hypothetical protein
MNLTKIAFCLAALCAVAQPAVAAEYKYRLITKRVDGFPDVNKDTRSVVSARYAGKYYQWFGSPYPCPKSGSSSSSPCKYTWKTAKSVATSWKVGTNINVKETYPGGEIAGQFSSEFSIVTTDTDEFSREYTFDPGITAEPVSYIERDLVTYQYSGAWVRDKNGVLCRPILSLIPLCDRYVWEQFKQAATATTLKQRSSQQTLTYLTYTNGQRPNYRLEPN